MCLGDQQAVLKILKKQCLWKGHMMSHICVYVFEQALILLHAKLGINALHWLLMDYGIFTINILGCFFIYFDLPTHF